MKKTVTLQAIGYDPDELWQRVVDAARAEPRRFCVIEAPAGEPKSPVEKRTVH